MGEEDEEDYGALIYRESQLRKAEVVAKNTKKRNKDSSADVSQFVLLHHLKSVQKTNLQRRSESHQQKRRNRLRGKLSKAE